MGNQTVVSTYVKRVIGRQQSDMRDFLTIEEPLEIRLSYYKNGLKTSNNIYITMRTPGHDKELALGFLFSEGIISSINQVEDIYFDSRKENIINVTLIKDVVPDLEGKERNFITNSSCGICGKSSIESLKIVCQQPYIKNNLKISSDIIIQLPEKLKKRQTLFEQTGGLHACALFNYDGELKVLWEDVGRHNAMDKLSGYALESELIPMSEKILLLSGRASFELIQKAIMAGINVVVAVGAPSSLAVELAEEWEITLIGFLRNDRFNIYSGAEKIVI